MSSVHGVVPKQEPSLLAPMLKNQPSPQPLMIDNQYLEMVQTTKILGVYLTSDLKWTKHVTHICSKESKRLCALRLLKRNGVQSRDLQKVYCRSFHSSHVIPNVLVIVVCHIVYRNRMLFNLYFLTYYILSNYSSIFIS